MQRKARIIFRYRDFCFPDALQCSRVCASAEAAILYAVAVFDVIQVHMIPDQLSCPITAFTAMLFGHQTAAKGTWK
jgi:hypothetical protein